MGADFRKVVRRNPEILNAIQWDGSNDEDVARAIKASFRSDGGSLQLIHDGGTIDLPRGDWLVVGGLGFRVYSTEEFARVFRAATKG